MPASTPSTPVNATEATGRGYRPRPTLIQFNKEIVFGECGSLLMAYVAAFLAAAFTRNPSLISGAMVAGTLSGGTLFWLAARIYHRRCDPRWSARQLAGDIGYFTPAALTLGFSVYDPTLFFASRHLLLRGRGVGHTVILAQLCAFTLFLGGMNGYRALILRVRGKGL